MNNNNKRKFKAQNNRAQYQNNYNGYPEANSLEEPNKFYNNPNPKNKGNRNNQFKHNINPGNYDQRNQYKREIEISNDLKPSRQMEIEEIKGDKYLFFPGEAYNYNKKIFHPEIFKIKSGALLCKKPTLLYQQDNYLSTNEIPTVESSVNNSEKNSIDNIIEFIGNPENTYKTWGKYYQPNLGDIVIGTVVQRFSELYRVDIGTYSYGVWNKVNTEGNKNAKLNAEIGDVLLCKVISINKNDAPGLSTENKKMMNEKVPSFHFHDLPLGIIKEGNVFDLPLAKVNCLSRYFKELNHIKHQYNANICIGNNGKVLINNAIFENIQFIYKDVRKCFGLDVEDIRQMLSEIDFELN